MDGLECVEISKKEVLENNECFRYDAEYFNKEATEYIKLIKSKKFKYIGEEFEVSKLAGFEYTEYFTNKNMSSDENYIALTSKNIQKNFLDLNDYITIDKEIADNFLKRSKLYKNDVILSYTGEYRRALKLYDENFQLGPNVCRIRPKNNCEIKSGLLSVFLNVSIGQSILDKEKTLSAQPTVAMSRIRMIPVPVFSDKFQSCIEFLVDKQNELNKEHIRLYEEVEKEFDCIIDYKEEKEKINYNIKSFRESVNSTNRLDAEYYQPKYDKMNDALKKFKSEKLGNLVIKQKSIEPGSEYYREEGIPFIRVGNLFKDKITPTNIFLNRNEIKDIEKLFPKKDTILLSKDGSIGIAYKVQENLEVVTSGAILQLKVKDTNKILPDYLTLVLNSHIVKLQAEKDSNGAIIQHWKPSNIDDVIIPVLDIKIQEKIAEKVKKSFELKNDAEKILEIAKKAIEIAIEQSEDEAIEYINKNK